MKKAQAKDTSAQTEKDASSLEDLRHHENPRNQSNQGNREMNAKLNAHRQVRQKGQRASGNKGGGVNIIC